MYALGHDYKVEFWLGLQLKKKKKRILKTTVVKNEYISLYILVSVLKKNRKYAFDDVKPFFSHLRL